MEFGLLIASRYSVRAYRPDSLEKEVLERILEAARLAPSAANRQPFQIVVVHTEGRRDDMRRIYNREWFLQAPLVAFVCGLPQLGWVRQDGRCYYLVDVAIAMDHLILASADLGVGTCWIANFDAQAAREVLGLPAEVDPVVLTPLGYPADLPKPKERRPMSDLVRYERW